MKLKKTLLIILLFLITNFSYSQDKVRNNIMVFDITGSMLGLGDNPTPNIWKETLELLKEQLNSFPPDEKITFYVFGEKLIKIGDYRVNGEETTNKIFEKVDSYRINKKTESWTCIYKALNTVIKNLDTNQINTVYLFTDGANSDTHEQCGEIMPINIANNWEETTRKNEYLYIFKLKKFNLPSSLFTKTVVPVEDALHNYTVFIEPINTRIKVTKKNMNSSQRFRVTGAGVAYIPQDLIMNISDIKLTSKSETEHASTEPNNYKIIKARQPFVVVTDNVLENISNDDYSAEFYYSFSDGSYKQQVKNDNLNITITIQKIPVKVLFNNKKDKPKVTIEFID